MSDLLTNSMPRQTNKPSSLPTLNLSNVLQTIAVGILLWVGQSTYSTNIQLAVIGEQLKTMNIKVDNSADKQSLAEVDQQVKDNKLASAVNAKDINDLTTRVQSLEAKFDNMKH